MGTRGRISAAGLAIIGPHGVETIRRPSPPESLSDEQAEEWRRVVNRMPADWFPAETHALLEQRCRHVIRARHLAQAIDVAQSADPFDVKAYRDLLRSEAEQSHTIAILDTKMRLSQQATYDKSKRKPNTSQRAPWATDKDSA